MSRQSETHSPASDSIEVNLLEVPSGGVRGTVLAFAEVKGKRRRVAHATLLVDAKPDISIDFPKRVRLEDIQMLTSVLNDFAVQVAACVGGF